MDSSSASCSSGLSSQSSSSREPTPEYDPIAAYEALAPLWWDEADWDFAVRSEDDESLTDREDNLQFLVDAEAQRYYRPAAVLPLDPAALPLRREPSRVGCPYPLPTYPSFG